MQKIISRISKDLKSKFFFDYNISKNVWFKAGGNVKVFCLVYDEKELEFILATLDNNFKYEIIGAGSNILIRDNGYNGIIFKLGKKFNHIEIKNSTLKVGASILDINLSRFAEINKIKNFEFYSGIPGSIGGAIKMNAGCYGNETKDVLKEIRVINIDGKINILNLEEINLSYRNSNIPNGNIITSATFNIEYGDKEEINNRINFIKQMRLESQPIQVKTSGSTFKNPKNNYAAKLIEKSGCKNLFIGDACVSQKHANFLINKKNATATEIEDLGKKIIQKVFKKFDIILEWEIKIIGN